MLLYSIDMDSRDQGITVHFHVVSEIFCWITGHSGACLFSILDEKGRKKLIEIALNTLTLRNNNNNLTFKCVNIHFFYKAQKNFTRNSVSSRDTYHSSSNERQRREYEY